MLFTYFLCQTSVLLIILCIIIGILQFNRSNGVEEVNLQRSMRKPGLIVGNNGWSYVGTHNLVKTYTKTIPGSNLVAFRGVTILDVHISHAMGPFVNISNSLEWVSMLKAVKSYPIIDKSEETKQTGSSSLNVDVSLAGAAMKEEQLYMQDDILYQVISLPWPVTARDILLKREFDFNADASMVTVKYHSIEDDRVPVNPSMIRAISPHTMWRFTGVNTTDLDEYEQSLLEEENEENNIAPLMDDDVPKNYESTGGIASFQWKNQLFPKSFRRYFSLNFIKSVSKKMIFIVKSFFRKMRNDQTLTLAPADASADTNLYQSVVIDKPASFASSKPMSTSVSSCSDLRAPTARTLYTLVEIETIVDSRGSIPTWFINFMQR
jgi:hypothetical protein